MARHRGDACSRTASKRSRCRCCIPTPTPSTSCASRTSCARRYPAASSALSSEVLPEIREYERTSTTVVNAYVGPVVSRYLQALRARCSEGGFHGRLLMMQSSGGTMDVGQVIERRPREVESGPAAGVIGALRPRRACRLRASDHLRHGGTTAKASLIERQSYGAPMNTRSAVASRSPAAWRRAAATRSKLPVIDVSEVGAGGGSIVRIDTVARCKWGRRAPARCRVRPVTTGAAPSRP